MRISEDPGPGRRLGRYELLSLIGEGGMAQVWAARMDGSRGFHKIVALKTLIPALAGDPQFQRMFLDEANLASRIHHRNVVEIHDLGDADGCLFLVMEWIDGQSMQRLIRPDRRSLPLTPIVAARIVADAAHGLHAAHELVDERGMPLGIVHRDVCPQNILIDRDGTVKVADFGIVKAFERLGDTTQTGEIKGKGEYMSPEQAQSHPVDRRSDIFSLGVVLFEAVTGERPFQASHDFMVMQQLISADPPRPSEVSPTCPRELEAIIVKALARDPRQRFQTAHAMAGELEQFLVRSTGVVTPAHVAEVLHARCGVQIDEVRHKIIAAAATPSQRGRWLPRPGVVLSAGPGESAPPPGMQAASGIPTGVSAASRLRGEVLRPLALPWLIAAVSTGVAAASLVFVALSRRVEPRVRVLPPPMVSGETPRGELPADVLTAMTVWGEPIDLLILPRDAVVRLNGAVIGVGDQRIARPAPGTTLSVEVQARGREAQTVELTSESPNRVELQLDRAGKDGPKAPAPPAGTAGSTGAR